MKITSERIERAELRGRALRACAELLDRISPVKAYMPIFLYHYPEYNEDQDRVRQVLNGRADDEVVVQKVEALVEKLKHS